MQSYPFTVPNVDPFFEHVQSFVDAKMADLAKKLPYSEEWGGLDFRGAKDAVAVNVEVINPDGLFLALRRTASNDSHVGQYNNVAGYMIGNGSGRILDCVLCELKEEIGLTLPFSADIKVGEILTVDKANGGVLYVIPVQVVLHKHHEVVFHPDFPEHDDFQWLSDEARTELDCIPIVHRVREQFGEVKLPISFTPQI